MNHTRVLVLNPHQQKGKYFKPRLHYHSFLGLHLFKFCENGLQNFSLLLFLQPDDWFFCEKNGKRDAFSYDSVMLWYCYDST